MIELAFLEGGKKVREAHPEISVWSFISEEHLQTKGALVEEENGAQDAPMCCGRDGKC